MALFKDELMTSNADMIVMVGDLFDHPYVGYAVVKEAAEAALAAATLRPEVTYVYLAGNHDLPRNITHVGAFHAFERMVAERRPNLRVVRTPTVHGGVAFFPWEWDRTAAEQVISFGPDHSVRHAVGHWDLKSYGGTDAHLAPVEELHASFPALEEVWSGHYHTPGDYPVGRYVVRCCGSLEPYSHGEGPQGDVYITLSREDAIAAANDGSIRDRCVRVLLAPGEDLPQLDALAVTPERVRAAQAESGQDERLTLGSLDWAGVLARKLKPLHPDVRSFITERLSTDDDTTEE